jgi:hypothetical protein
VATKEAKITINGTLLSSAQSMAVRCAVGNFLMQLDDPKFRKSLGEIGNNYKARLAEVEKLILRTTE